MLKVWSEKFRLAKHFDKKFSLNEDVYLVKGSKRSAIYDLATGDVYSVDETFTNTLDLALMGQTPKEIVMEVDKNLYEVIRFLTKLADQGLAEWYEGPTRSSPSYKDLPPPPWHLQFAWLELTNRCNLRCIHCYSDSGSSQLLGKGALSREHFGRLISELAELGCSAVQLTGGEALLMEEQLLDLVVIAKGNGIKVEVFTNLTLLTTTIAKFFKEHDVQVGTSLYASNEQLHDSITRVKGSFARTVQSIRELVSGDITVRIGIVAMPQNENSLNETIRFAKEELGVVQVRASQVLHVGRGCGIASDDFIPLGDKLTFPKISKEDFIARVYGHGCWRGKIAIAPTGDVFPCPPARDIVLGNVKRQSLSDIIVSDHLKQIWELTKDKIETCQDCEYRYACFDCRGKAKNLTSKPTDCWYNPYES